MVYNPYSGWPVTGDWLEHLSYSEGGTDYPLGYGTELPAPGAGRLQNNGWVGSAGRRATLYLDVPAKRQITGQSGEGAGDMVAVVFQHASAFYVDGQYAAGQSVGRSGASANGADYGGDVHLHIHGLNASGQRVDFTKFIDGITTNPPQEEEDDMAAGTLIKRQGAGAVYWQEHPLAPLYPINPGQFAAYQNQGLKLNDLAPGNFDGIIQRVGQYTLNAQQRRIPAGPNDAKYDGWQLYLPNAPL